MLLDAALAMLLLLGLSPIADAMKLKDEKTFRHLGRWCCLNEPEYMKCEQWRLASNQTDTNTNVILECVKGTDKFDCFKKIFEDAADLMTADAGEVYTAGKFYNLMPITTELYSSLSNIMYSEQYAVAVVKKNSTGESKSI